MPHRENYFKEYREKNVYKLREYNRLYMKKWREEHREEYLFYGKKYSRLYRERNKLKNNARKILFCAVRNGSIRQQPCAVCDSPITEAHHTDYNKPLQIIWLCKKHHSHYPQEKNKLSSV